MYKSLLLPINYSCDLISLTGIIKLFQWEIKSQEIIIILIKKTDTKFKMHII